MLKSKRVRAKRSGGGSSPVAQAFAGNYNNFSRKPLHFKPAALAKAIAGVFVSSAMIGGYGQAWAIEINEQMNLLPRIHIQSEGAVRTEEILQSSKATGSKLSLNGAVFVETDSQLNTDTLTFDYVSNSGQISNWNFTVGSTPVTTTTGKTINLPNLKNIENSQNT